MGPRIPAPGHIAVAGDKPAIFSVDVEDPFPGAADGSFVFLDFLDELGIKGTFFIVGMLAERRPDIVDAIHAAGHELACHAWCHPYISEAPAERPPFVDELSEEALDADCRRCVSVVTRADDKPVGFRAPWYRIAPANLPVIARYFCYDSSFTAKIAQQIAFPRDLREIPVSSFGIRGPHIASSTLFGPLAMRAGKWFADWASPAAPLMIYAHSFDMSPPPTVRLYTSPMKRAWYFDRCGPKRRDDLVKFIRWLQEVKGYRFIRARDLLSRDLRASATQETGACGPTYGVHFTPFRQVQNQCAQNAVTTTI